MDLNYAIYIVFKAFWPWIPYLHRARSILEPASVLRKGLSAAFRVICSMLSRVSFWIYFRLVRVYLGDQRMRRVKDQDEEGKGPVDQEDPGTRGSRGPRDRGTKGPEDQGTRGAGDQSTRGTKGSGEPDISFPSIYFFSPRVLVFFQET